MRLDLMQRHPRLRTFSWKAILRFHIHNTIGHLIVVTYPICVRLDDTVTKSTLGIVTWIVLIRLVSVTILRF